MRIEKIDRSELLVRYKEHLDKTRGLAPASQKGYLLIARRFLESLCSTRQIKLSMFTAAAVTAFVRRDTGARTGQGPKTSAAGTRSFIRFLISVGVGQPGLDAAVPKVRWYRHASVPACFSESEIEQILAFCEDGSQKGIRDYALLALISRLGLRVGEAANLTLDDIDWHEGCIVIRAGKNRRERRLPLAADLGKILIEYLRLVRPRVEDRHLFLHWVPPFTGYEGSSLGKAVNRLIARAGMKRSRGGGHILRHSAATNMVNRGASFKEIADLMGHQSLSATAIYAKLDFERLGQMALPWPGGAP